MRYSSEIEIVGGCQDGAFHLMPSVTFNDDKHFRDTPVADDHSTERLEEHFKLLMGECLNYSPWWAGYMIGDGCQSILQDFMKAIELRFEAGAMSASHIIVRRSIKTASGRSVIAELVLFHRHGFKSTLGWTVGCRGVDGTIRKMLSWYEIEPYMAGLVELAGGAVGDPEDSGLIPVVTEDW